MKPTPSLNEPSLTFRVRGDLTRTSGEALRAEVKAAFESPDSLPSPRTVVLDLTTATMVDSVGLNLIVWLLKTLQKQGGKLEVAYSSPNVLRTFAFTRLDRQITLVKA